SLHRDHLDLEAGEPDHVAPLAADHRLARRHAVARSEDPVVRGGGAAALEVAERDRAGLEARALLEFARDGLADLPGLEDDVLEAVVLGLARQRPAAGRVFHDVRRDLDARDLRAFGHDYDAVRL